MPGPSNLYGTANPLPYPVQTGASTSVPCPGGTETQVFAFPPLIATSPGLFYPVAFISVLLTLSATPSTACSMSVRIHNGSDLFTLVIPGQLQTANNNIWVQACMPGNGLALSFAPPGVIVEITCSPQTNAITAGHVGFESWCFLFRAPDQ